MLRLLLVRMRVLLLVMLPGNTEAETATMGMVVSHIAMIVVIGGDMEETVKVGTEAIEEWIVFKSADRDQRDN